MQQKSGIYSILNTCEFTFFLSPNNNLFLAKKKKADPLSLTTPNLAIIMYPAYRRGLERPQTC